MKQCIESGQFTINSYTAQVTFNEKDLNIGWDETGKW